MENHICTPEHLKGKWIRESLVTNYPYKCSACKKYSRAMYDFCPNCGADMRGEMEHNYTKEIKKSELENHVEVIIYSHSMSVVFNDVDIDQILEFVHFLDVHLCKYEQPENGFEITANMDTLYSILLYITFNFEDVAIY